MDIARLGLEVDSSDVRKASGDLDRFGRQGDKTANSVTKSMKRTAVAVASVAAAAATLRKAFQAAESYTKMTNSLRAMGLSSEQAANSLERIAGIAQCTRAPLEATEAIPTD